MKKALPFLNTLLIASIAVILLLIYNKMPYVLTQNKIKEISKIEDEFELKKVLDNLPYYNVNVKNRSLEVDAFIVNDPIQIDGTVKVKGKVIVEGEVATY